MDNLKDYTYELISEIELQIELDGRHEVKQYASYWLKDIYDFCFQNCSTDETSIDYCHAYNPQGVVAVEEIADSIYEIIKCHKIFKYFFDTYHAHLRDLIKSLGETPVSFIAEPDYEFEACESLYDIDRVLPISLSSNDVCAYLEDDFIPDYMEYEALRRASKELEKVMPMELALVDQTNLIQTLMFVLRRFELPLDRNIEVVLLDDKRALLTLCFHGICNANDSKEIVFYKVYEYSCSGLGLIELLENFFTDAVQELIGIAKVKGSDVDAQYGRFAMKDMSYHGLKQSLPIHLISKELELAELQSLYTIKQSLLLPGKPVISTSFGADSGLMHWLISKVYQTIDVYHGKTGLDFPEIYAVEKEFKRMGLIQEGHYFIGKNETSYWDLVDQYGFNFDRKGDRRNKKPGKSTNMSELCCNVLKHLPFKKVSAKENWSINFAGLRADESRARELAIKRDGPLYYAKSWEQTRVNPIVHWTQEQVWEYIAKNGVPYASIYDDLLTNDDGEVIYKPRIGCWACMLSAKYGYLKWLKRFKPKQYRYLMVDKGLLKLLYAKKMGVELDADENGNITLEAVKDLDVDSLLGFLEARPCFFDETLKEIS